MRFGDYLTWRERQPDLATVATQAVSDVKEDSPTDTPLSVRRCPDGGHVLMRYRVGHGVPFSLDRCGACNGVWFDRAEWESLSARGLHRQLPEIFGPSWQFGLRSEEQRTQQEQRFSDRLGPDLGRVREFADWIAEHPRCSEILAYVQSRLR